MADIDITRFISDAEPFEFSASRAERGDNAGPETWANALTEAAERPLLSTDEELDALRDDVKGYGAWEPEEIDGWSPAECNALFIQMISGDIREAESLCPGDGPGGIDWAEYEKLAERGTLSGRMYLGTDASVRFYLGN